MEQENKQMNSLPDNAYRELAPGEEYKPMMPANTKPQGGYALFRDIRYYHGGYLFRGSSLPWVESRTSIRGCNSYRYYCCWCGQYVGEEKYVGTKRDYPVYRS